MSNESADLIRQKLRILKGRISQTTSDIMQEEDEISDIASRIRMLINERDLLEKQIENKQSLLTEFEIRKSKLENELGRNGDLASLSQEEATTPTPNLLDQIRSDLQIGLEGIKDELEKHLEAKLAQVLSQCHDEDEARVFPLSPPQETAEEIAGPQSEAGDPENDPDNVL